MTEDWRWQGQRDDLVGATLRYQEYRAPSAEWDHDHCEFCWAKFMEPLTAQKTGRKILPSGYFCAAQRCWICATCYRDFHDRFQWRVDLPDDDPDVESHVEAN